MSQQKTPAPENSIPFQFQLSYINEHSALNNLLQNYGTKEARNFGSYEHKFSSILTNRKHSNVFLNSESQHDTIIKKIGKPSKALNFTVIDLSNIKELPRQEKIDLEELDEHRRRHKRWTKEEDHLLCELKKDLKLSWKEIASRFPARTLKACQFRLSKLKMPKKRQEFPFNFE